MPTVTRGQYKKQLKLFGKLSPELRTMIYKLVIPEGQTINLDDPPLSPALCRTCPQIQAESIGLWRGESFRARSDLPDLDLEWVKPWVAFSTKDWAHQIPDKKTDVHIKLVIKGTAVNITFMRSADPPITWAGLWEKMGVRKMANAKADGMIRLLESLLERTLVENGAREHEPPLSAE
ncbi:hypothetical protein LTR37_001604 [Vermiconidia calcicola]|uniref:Uncharacterized protein n=1 Tax=Vermiconidia calcicola TaxID=1690605 RepID=A0ACC3NVM3_9PEZI|nr:hypothetical protein LTR37_001604 [Vermiconidia calcicola]